MSHRSRDTQQNVKASSYGTHAPATQIAARPGHCAHSRYLISQTSALDAFRRWQTFNFGMPVEKGCDIVFLIGTK